jgi:hypothetical protein
MDYRKKFFVDPAEKLRLQSSIRATRATTNQKKRRSRRPDTIA